MPVLANVGVNIISSYEYRAQSAVLSRAHAREKRLQSVQHTASIVMDMISIVMDMIIHCKISDHGTLSAQVLEAGRYRCSKSTPIQKRKCDIQGGGDQTKT